MNKVEHIIYLLDQEIEKFGMEYLTPPQANRVLKREDILNDNEQRPGLPLRSLLREGFLPHAYKERNNWRIPHSKKIYKKKDSENINSTKNTKKKTAQGINKGLLIQYSVSFFV